MCLNPKFDEFFELGNLPTGSTLVAEVWDRDMVTDDDLIGRTSWQFVPKEVTGIQDHVVSFVLDLRGC